MKRLKIGICLLCAVWLILAVPCFGSEFSIECDCNQSPCACYLQFGDKGAAMRAVITLLKAKGYMQETRVKVLYTDTVEIAVKAFQKAHQLPADGLLDDRTLTLLVYDKYPLDDPAEKNQVVWVPTNGGEKYHKDRVCDKLPKQMIAPRKISLYNAAGLNIEPCKLCKPPELVPEM